MSSKISSMEQILNTAASGMSAQSIRMNTVSSNLANSGSIGGSPETTYRTKYPVFSEITRGIKGLDKEDQPIGGVRVTGVEHSKKALDKHYDPNHPLADKNGFVYNTDVNPIEQMTDMIAASKEYQANVEVMNTTKNLIMQTLSVINTK